MSDEDDEGETSYSCNVESDSDSETETHTDSVCAYSVEELNEQANWYSTFKSQENVS